MFRPPPIRTALDAKPEPKVEAKREPSSAPGDGETSEAFEEAAYKALVGRNETNAKKRKMAKAAKDEADKDSDDSDDSGHRLKHAAPIARAAIKQEAVKGLLKKPAAISAHKDSLLKRPASAHGGSFEPTMNMRKADVKAMKRTTFTSKHYHQVKKEGEAYGLPTDMAKVHAQVAYKTAGAFYNKVMKIT